MTYTRDILILRALPRSQGDDDDVRYVDRFCDYDLPKKERDSVGLRQRIWQAACALAGEGHPRQLCGAIVVYALDRMIYAAYNHSARALLQHFGALERAADHPGFPGWDLPSVKALRERFREEWLCPDHEVMALARRHGHSETAATG